jgi:hypothetical protein
MMMSVEENDQDAVVNVCAACIVAEILRRSRISSDEIEEVISNFISRLPARIKVDERQTEGRIRERILRVLNDGLKDDKILGVRTTYNPFKTLRRNEKIEVHIPSQIPRQDAAKIIANQALISLMSPSIQPQYFAVTLVAIPISLFVVTQFLWHLSKKNLRLLTEKIYVRINFRDKKRRINTIPSDGGYLEFKGYHKIIDVKKRLVSLLPPGKTDKVQKCLFSTKIKIDREDRIYPIYCNDDDYLFLLSQLAKKSMLTLTYVEKPKDDVPRILDFLEILNERLRRFAHPRYLPRLFGN